MLQVLVVLVLVVSSLALAAYDARRDAADGGTSERALAVAAVGRRLPHRRRRASRARAHATVLQPYAEEVRVDTDVDFVA